MAQLRRVLTQLEKHNVTYGHDYLQTTRGALVHMVQLRHLLTQLEKHRVCSAASFR